MYSRIQEPEKETLYSINFLIESNRDYVKDENFSIPIGTWFASPTNVSRKFYDLFHFDFLHIETSDAPKHLLSVGNVAGSGNRHIHILNYFIQSH
jgi:hypothetical protein